MLKLYDYFRSSACYRVRIALNYKDLPYQIIPIHLINQGGEQHSISYLNVNPQALVPTLEDDNHYISQSLAIIEYLEDKYPLPPLLPTAPLSKAYVKSIALLITADIHPLNNLRVLNYLEKNLQMNETQKLKWYQEWVARGFTALEQKLKLSSYRGYFCYGDQPTLADVCLIPQIYNAKRFNCNVEKFPLICQIEKNCQQLAAFRNASPQEEPAQSPSEAK